MSPTKPRGPSGRPAPSTKGRAAAQKPTRRRGLPILLILGIVVAAGLAAVIVLTVATGDNSPLEVGTPTVTGDPLVRFASGTNDPAVGQLAPEATGADFDGTPVNITNDGRAKLILFVAHWCSVCRQEVPAIVDWLPGANVPDNVDLYTVSTGVDRTAPNYPPSKWLDREGWTLPVLMDDEQRSVATAFGLSAYPYFVLVGSDGRVLLRLTGALPAETLNGLVSGLAEA